MGSRPGDASTQRPTRFGYASRSLGGALSNGGILSMIDQGVIAAGSFIANIAIGRFTAVTAFGIYLLLVSIFSFLSDLQTSLLISPYMITRPGLPPHERDTYRASVITQGLCILTLAVGAALAVGIEAAVSGRTPVTFIAAPLLALCLGAMLLRDQIRRIRIADLDILGATLIDTGATALLAVGMSVLAVFGTLTLSSALAAASIAFALPCVAWLRREFPANSLEQMRHHIIFNWHHGRWLFLSALVWAAINYSYPWVIAYFHGVEPVGEWAAAFSSLALCNVPILGLQNYAGARILRDGVQDGFGALRGSILKWIALFTGVSVAGLAVYALFGDEIVVLLYGSKYRGLGMLAAILAFNIVLASANFCVSRGLFALKRADLDLAVNVVPVVFLSTMGIWLIANFGPVGAAVSLCGSSALSLAARIAVFNSITRTKPEF